MLNDHGLKISKTRENRIDYCYHTNEISNPNKVFRSKNDKIFKNLFTNLKKYNIWGDIVGQTQEGAEYLQDYVRLGSISTKNVLARVYDKVKEVIEQGYKSYFFKLWYEQGLISYYDNWCFEYAYLHKSIDYLAHARLEFYIQHGKDTDRREKYDKLLNNKNKKLADIKREADEFMPKTTSVLNIEYQTMRRFYVNSDDFIERCGINQEREGLPEQLKRIYKILDNRHLYLAYLTDDTLSFKEVRDGKLKYKAWWKRLRDTKINDKKLCEKMLREYSHEMDIKVIKQGAINKVNSFAVYNDNVETEFIEDASDFLAEINDNKARKMKVIIADEHGEIIEKMDSELLRRYAVKKAKLEVRLKNRKKKKGQATAQENSENTADFQKETPENGMRMIKCKICGDLKPTSEFVSYGGRGSENLGKCKKCFELVSEIYDDTCGGLE